MYERQYFKTYKFFTFFIKIYFNPKSNLSIDCNLIKGVEKIKNVFLFFVFPSSTGRVSE